MYIAVSAFTSVSKLLQQSILILWSV